MDSGINVSEIHNHLTELANLTERFSTLSNQSIDKFGKIIETAQGYRAKMDPLNTYMESLQIQKQNIQASYDRLNQIQEYRKTAKELEAVVEYGPSESLQAYLNILEQVQQVFEFFKKNSIDETECRHLQSLYAIGLKKLTDEVEKLLRSAFSTLDVNELCTLVEKSASANAQPAADPMDEVALIEIASEPTIESLRTLIHWLKSGKGSMIAVCTQGGDVIRICSIRYQDYRKNVVITAMKALHRLLKTRESRQPIGAPVARLTRIRPKRPPGFVWDVSMRRVLNPSETEELHSERYALMLAALVKLMQNERRWLLRIQLTHNLIEAQSCLESIVKLSAEEVLNEGKRMIQMMQYAQKRAEFHMVLSLLVVLKKIAEIGPELVQVLQGVEQLLNGFHQLTFCLLQETSSSLWNYVAFLGQLPEHTIVNQHIVPPDAIVHELTTNSFLFFEHLLEFADVLSVAFRSKEMGIKGNVQAVTFLCQNVKQDLDLGPQVGRFLLDSIASLIHNLEYKSACYSEELLQLVFQMNNLQYILKTVNRTDIHRYILSYDREGIASISSRLDNRRARYIECSREMLHLHGTSGSSSGTLRRRASMLSAAVVSMLSPSTPRAKHSVPSIEIPSPDSSAPKMMDSKDRSAVKSIWENFNSGLDNFTRLHTSLSIPDRELRETLQQQLLADLVPIYTQLWRQSMQVAFSTRREKYMRLSVPDFEAKLKSFF